MKLVEHEQTEGTEVVKGSLGPVVAEVASATFGWRQTGSPRQSRTRQSAGAGLLSPLIRTSRARRLSSTAVYPPCPCKPQVKERLASNGMADKLLQVRQLNNRRRFNAMRNRSRVMLVGLFV